MQNNITQNQRVEKTKVTLIIKNARINIDNNISIKDIKRLSKEVPEMNFKRLVY